MKQETPMIRWKAQNMERIPNLQVSINDKRSLRVYNIINRDRFIMSS